MRAPTLGGNTAVFFLFFGVSLLEAGLTHSWMKALMWFGFGGMFLLADMSEGRKENPH